MKGCLQTQSHSGTSFFKKLFVYVFGCTRSWLWHTGASAFVASCRIFQSQHVNFSLQPVGSSSLTMDQTQVPFIGSEES